MENLILSQKLEELKLGVDVRGFNFTFFLYTGISNEINNNEELSAKIDFAISIEDWCFSNKNKKYRSIDSLENTTYGLLGRKMLTFWRSLLILNYFSTSILFPNFKTSSLPGGKIKFFRGALNQSL